MCLCLGKPCFRAIVSPVNPTGFHKAGTDVGHVHGYGTAALWDLEKPRRLAQTLLGYPLNLAGARSTPKSAGLSSSLARPGTFPQAVVVPPWPGLIQRPLG